jgi:hypothetical protein
VIQKNSSSNKNKNHSNKRTASKSVIAYMTKKLEITFQMETVHLLTVAMIILAMLIVTMREQRVVCLPWIST